MVSSTNNFFYGDDITDILLKVVLNTITSEGWPVQQVLKGHHQSTNYTKFGLSNYAMWFGLEDMQIDFFFSIF
jgi:hypothetical protein